MLNEMAKVDIFVPHPLTNASLLIQLSPEYGCKPLVYLLKRPVTIQSEVTRLARWRGCRKTTNKAQNK